MSATGCVPTFALPKHAPGGGAVVTGLPAMNQHPLTGAGGDSRGGPGFRSRFGCFREMRLPSVEIQILDFTSAATRSES